MVVGIVSLSMEQPRKSNFLVPLMCSSTYHVGAPRTRPHEMWVCKKYCDEISQTPPHPPHEIWVCKKAKSIVIGILERD